MCDLCKRYPCVPACPNHTPPKALHYCSFCGEGIYEGEEFVENADGEFIHFDCVQGIRWLLEWLGYDIKTAESIDVIREEWDWISD